MTARWSLYQPAIRSFSGALIGAADVADADRRAVSIGDHEIGVIVRVQQLVVGVERVGLARAVERALRQVDIGLSQRGADVLEIDAARGKRLWIKLHPDRRLLLAADTDEADARYLRDLEPLRPRLDERVRRRRPEDRPGHRRH